MSARKRISRLVARDRKTLEETLSAGSKSGLKAPISSSKKPNKGDVKPDGEETGWPCRQDSSLGHKRWERVRAGADVGAHRRRRR
ncbi:uncharacterized protein LOC105438869 isoform X2 [Strongylocentrotus purpuratus]|uniref:Uncharacterized protein n=1 Tax=Strongylocentrotus purpuratus TaxID=7668 RepID=A0A7M7PTS6_STRPU|nr:uncharacterized protein LOC105438869 isoform X2 [Strongylocentrotus purpuratus]